MNKKIKLYMGLPSTGTRSDAQTYLLREVEERYKDEIEFVYPSVCIYRTFHDFARNSIVDEFLQTDCDILWFLDSDVVPPKYILDLIVVHGDKWKAAGACYPIFMTPPGGKEQSILFTAYKGVVNNEYGTVQGNSITEVPRSGTEFIDGLATGCMFLKREVFKDLKKPYFQFKYNEETMQMKEGEDLGFCVKLNKLGIKFFTDYSMVCKHYKTLCLLDLNNYAIEFANSKVLSYDREIRPQIEQAIKTVYEKGVKDGKNSAPKAHGPRVTDAGIILPG